MAKYSVDFSYMVPEWDTIEVEAESIDEAKIEAEECIADILPEAIDIEITEVKELTHGKS